MILLNYTPRPADHNNGGDTLGSGGDPCRDSGVKVGLVLGAGGFVGGAWLTGALEAIEEETGWRPRQADHIVGTSAGAMIAALTAAGVPACEIPGLFIGKDQDSAAVDPALRARPVGAALKLQGGIPNPLFASLRLALTALRHPRQVPVGVVLAAILPRGPFSTEPLKDTVRQIVPDGWVGHPNLWLMATDLDTGERVAFGREGAPAADLAGAVAASCAIPGFYHPVSIDGRSFVDGGCWSPANLDILEPLNLDVVICLNPTSSLERSTRWRDSLSNVYRNASGRQLAWEAHKLRRTGTRIVLFQPSIEALLVMGTNLMRSDDLELITDVARESVTRQLRTPEYRACISALRKLAGADHPSAPRRAQRVASKALGRISRASRRPARAQTSKTA
jgi:NTE family protein